MEPSSRRATTTPVAAFVLYSRSIPSRHSSSTSSPQPPGAPADAAGDDRRHETGSTSARLPGRAPTPFGLVQARPVPLFGGVYPEDEVATLWSIPSIWPPSRVSPVPSPAPTVRCRGSERAAEEPPPHHDALHRDRVGTCCGAPHTKRTRGELQDEEARLGLAQIGLLAPTGSICHRAAAAERPDDVDAQLLVADLDVLGGHVEDAFTRLVDLVRTTAGADRDRVRTHLLELFEVVGPADERVRRGRTALMSALF